MKNQKEMELFLKIANRELAPCDIYDTCIECPFLKIGKNKNLEIENGEHCTYRSPIKLYDKYGNLI